jgi:hypothetical protein
VNRGHCSVCPLNLQCEARSLEAQWRGIAGTSTKCGAVPGAGTFRGQGPAGMSGRQRPKRLGRNSQLQRAEVEACLRSLHSLRWYR